MRRSQRQRRARLRRLRLNAGPSNSRSQANRPAPAPGHQLSDTAGGRRAGVLGMGPRWCAGYRSATEHAAAKPRHHAALCFGLEHHTVREHRATLDPHRFAAGPDQAWLGPAHRLMLASTACRSIEVSSSALKWCRCLDRFVVAEVVPQPESDRATVRQGGSAAGRGTAWARSAERGAAAEHVGACADRARRRRSAGAQPDRAGRQPGLWRGGVNRCRVDQLLHRLAVGELADRAHLPGGRAGAAQHRHEHTGARLTL